MKTSWPKLITEWHDERMGYLSIPFTWLLPKAQERIRQRDMFIKRWTVGGPAVKLMPGYLTGATISDSMDGVLQRVNPQATKTTTGCDRNCKFCGIRRIEGTFRELDDWPDKPILCDNNLLAASNNHFDRVIDRLVKWGWCDFNQGLDARLLTDYHAQGIARIKRPIVRLALDHDRDREEWAEALDVLRYAGIAKSKIRTYVLCGFEGGPTEDRQRCEYVESFGIKSLPMWFHGLDALKQNTVSEEQRRRGWTNRKRRELMCWFYWHRTLGIRG